MGVQRPNMTVPLTVDQCRTMYALTGDNIFPGYYECRVCGLHFYFSGRFVGGSTLGGLVEKP